MCIIAIKKSGVPFPSEEIIENMWYRNPDGAGLMYTDGSGRVNIDKGYMTLSDFTRRIEELKQEIDVEKEAVVLHFRIGTSGGNIAANTHPFPISKRVKDLKALHLRTRIGVVHNGIIQIDRPIEDISDTMEYIRTKLHRIYQGRHWFYKDKDTLEKIERQITSKMAFLTANREVTTVGKFITEKDGMIYSNTSYEGFQYAYTGAWNGGYYRGYYNYDYNYSYGCGSYYGSGAKKREKKKDLNKKPVLNPVADLMLLDDEDYIVDYDSGSMAQVSDLGVLAIDKSGFVYVIAMDDYGYEVAYYAAENCAAFTPDGVDVKWKENEAMWIEVEDAMMDVFFAED
jgi:hypothetical protein